MADKKFDKSLEDTGERMIPAYSKGLIVYGEHMARYEAVAPLVEGKTVLDIASGSGYGSELLSKTAKEVIGVDISTEAVNYASKNYASKKVRFIEGSGTEIPLKSDSVDVVVTFETIEHIEEYEIFLKEVKRVLRPEGLLILSTPNDEEYSEDNHFHIHEFKEDELKSLLKKYYKNIEVYHQGDWIYTAILPKNYLEQEWTEDIATQQLAPIKSSKSIYFLILASDEHIKKSIPPLAVIGEHWSAKAKQASENIFKQHMDEQAAIINHFQNEINTQKHNVEQLEEELRNIKQTLYWRTTKIASKLKSKLPKRS